MSPISNYETISMTKHWPYKHPTVSQMKDAELYMVRNPKEQRIQVVGCKQCDFLVPVNKWRYSNPSEEHADACPNCPFSKQYHQYVAKQQARLAKERAEQQAEQTRLAKERRLAEQAEEARLIKKRAELLLQQEAEQARIEKERLEAFACRRCPAKFPSNTKLHQHVQDHHQKKAEKPAANESVMPSPPSPITPSEPTETTPTAVSAPIPTPPPTPKAVATMPTPPATPPPPSEPALMLTPPTSPAKPTSDTSLPLTPPATPVSTSEGVPSPPATPRKPLSWAEIVSRPVTAPKPSRLPVLSPKPVPTCTETASVTCPPTPPPTPPQELGSKHQKSYLTIDDLYEMFAEKPTKTGRLHTKKRPSSPSISSLHQTSITSYFRPAANQGKPISQGSKTPNPRSFQQHTPAESNRAKSIPPTPSKWSEKSAIIPYKTSTFSRLPNSEISSILPYKLPVVSGRLSRSPTPRAPFGISACSHVCRICSGTFGSNNGLHRHLRAIHFGQAPRHGSEKLRAAGRNTMAWRSLTC